MGFNNILHCEQRLLQCRSCVSNLSVGKHAAGFNGVAEANLPWGDSELGSQQIQVALPGEASLCNSKAAERTGGNVIGIESASFNINIINLVRTRCVRASPLQNRTTQ